MMVISIPSFADNVSIHSPSGEILKCSFESLNVNSNPSVRLNCLEDTVQISDRSLSDGLNRKVLTVNGKEFCLEASDDENSLKFNTVPIDICNSLSPNVSNYVYPEVLPAGSDTITINLVEESVAESDLSLPGLKLLNVRDSRDAVTPKLLSVSEDGQSVIYQPPEELSSDMPNRIIFQVTCDECVPSPKRVLTVNISASDPKPTKCNRRTGENCYGQTASGKWYTLNEELSGIIEEPLFVPSFANYHTAIYSNPSLAAESYWGCGPETDIAVGDKFDCNFFRDSLLGNVTYAMRLDTRNGELIRDMNLSTEEMLDDHGFYMFEVSDSPQIQSDDISDFCKSEKPSSRIRFSVYMDYPGGTFGCEYLRVDEFAYPRLYLKFTAVNIDERNADNCGRSDYMCRMYVQTWGND